MKRLRVSRLAERDLDGIWQYVAADAGNIDVADQVVDSIVGHFALLARQPQTGRTRQDIDSGVRSFPSGNYPIYYRDSKSHVVISRVLHGKRDHLAAWKKPKAT
jgi:toxin ParE1/3/4